MSTLVACEDTVDRQQRFRAVLSGEVTWSVVGSNPTLTAADGCAVTYRAAGS